MAEQDKWRLERREEERELEVKEIRWRFAAVAAVKEILHGVIKEACRTGVGKERGKSSSRSQELKVKPLNKKEKDALKKSQANMDKMISILDTRMPEEPNHEKLEIFQRLRKMETILEYTLSSVGVPLTPLKFKAAKEQGPKKCEPALQLSMGPNITPTKFKSKEQFKQKKAVQSAAIETNVNENNKDEPIISVYKCINCSNAFEKINLFVKHFIQNHKDIINANRNSKNFSFSNYWAKIKVKTNSSKKLDPSNLEVVPDEDKNDVKKKAPTSRVLNLKEDRDLEMVCETAPTPAPKAVKKTSSKKAPKKKEEAEEDFTEFAKPVEASSCVFSVEAPVQPVLEVVVMDRCHSSCVFPYYCSCF